MISCWQDLYNIWVKEKGGDHPHWTSLHHTEQSAWEVTYNTFEGNSERDSLTQKLDDAENTLYDFGIRAEFVCKSYKNFIKHVPARRDPEFIEAKRVLEKGLESLDER